MAGPLALGARLVFTQANVARAGQFVRQIPARDLARVVLMAGHVFRDAIWKIISPPRLVGPLVRIRVDVREPQRMLRNISNDLAKAARNAVNDTATHVRAEAVRDIRAKWNVKAGELRRRIKITPRATLASPVARVQADGEPIPLLAFGARQIRQGVSVAIVKGARTVIKGGFITTMKSGHRGVFVRAGRRRLPILEKKAISIPSQWNQRIDEHTREARVYLRKRLNYQLERVVAQSTRK